jgi:hypothetical protein
VGVIRTSEGSKAACGTNVQYCTGREDEIGRHIGHGVEVNVGAVKIDRYIRHGVGVNVVDQNSSNVNTELSSLQTGAMK